ncbi:hypothetical protein FQN54_009406 [Arachnomyces sp. PD_36]|nr:hypothetical protein FQN54_009406 [Arachnomyces sp. PD_36]
MPSHRRPPRAGALTDLAPVGIIKKIIFLQTAYYASATALILFTTLVAGKRFHPGLILSWRSIRGDTTVGWTLGLVWMLNSLIGVVFLLLLISRSKLVPDFALTIHFVHLIVTSLYTHSLPTNWLWWGLQFSSAALMTFLGIWACQWRELRPISFGGNAGAVDGNVNGQAEESGGGGGGGDTGNDETPSISRGRGRGRNRDGGGEYEMVGMKEVPNETV